MDNKKGLGIDSKLAKEIVDLINDAVGDEIKENIRRLRLRTHNSTPAMIWDFLNRDLCEHFDSADCMSYITKRGPWEMVMVFEKQSGYLYTFMREKRFAQLCKDEKRKNMHYLDMLTRHLNSDLVSQNDQLTLFEKQFNDQDKLDEAIAKMLEALHKDGAIIERHVLVLFESAQFSLSSVRAVMIDSKLNIAKEENWSQYITAEESLVAEVADTTSVMNSPTKGLTLTKKAVERKKSNPLRKKEEDIEAQ